MTTVDNLSILKGKVIENITVRFNENGNATSFIIYTTDGKETEVYTQITFHGNEEHSAESELVVEMKT